MKLIGVHKKSNIQHTQTHACTHARTQNTRRMYAVVELGSVAQQAPLCFERERMFFQTASNHFQRGHKQDILASSGRFRHLALGI